MMPEENTSFIKDFVITGFPGLPPQYYSLAAAVFFFIYLFTLAGNALFTSLFLVTPSLHKPVYYFILNLVACDVLFSTTTLPKIISRYWFQEGSISFIGCFVQMFFVHYLGTVCSCALALMALDRYVAICFPLRYHSIMIKRNVFILILSGWILSFPSLVTIVARAFPLPYCGGNSIVHCYCDHISVTSLACTDRSLYGVPATINALLVLLGCLGLVLFSYSAIFLVVMRISNAQGRMKMFSTCSPQLIIVTLFFLPRCFIYLAANLNIKFSTDLRLVIIVMYSLLPPMINPLIYCLRTEEVKKVLKQCFQKKQIEMLAFFNRG